MKKHIHIFGASGSGTTSIAKEAAKRLGYKHLDTDSYYWIATEEPFTVMRDTCERSEMLIRDMDENAKWINSGSVMGWDDNIRDKFDLAVFITVPHDVRMSRLAKREYDMFGDRILPGGDRYELYTEFYEWASAYEIGGVEGKTLRRHEEWIKSFECDVVRIENIDFEKSIEMVIKAIKQEE